MLVFSLCVLCAVKQAGQNIQNAAGNVGNAAQDAANQTYNAVSGTAQQAKDTIMGTGQNAKQDAKSAADTAGNKVLCLHPCLPDPLLVCMYVYACGMSI